MLRELNTLELDQVCGGYGGGNPEPDPMDPNAIGNHIVPLIVWTDWLYMVIGHGGSSLGSNSSQSNSDDDDDGSSNGGNNGLFGFLGENEILVEGMRLTDARGTDAYRNLSSIELANILEGMRDGFLDRYLSIGWSFGWIAAGGTIYTDGNGVFIGIARPGPVVSGGESASGDEQGWDVGFDSVLWQSGPVNDNSVAVYYDAERDMYYITGQVYNEFSDSYTTPAEREADMLTRGDDAPPFGSGDGI